ncbi:MAG: dipeptide ABC transporter ATP-binding protein [Christensenellaceae bacterium]|nr:dipeptide ABC transporter ATP-binding protein [Christensenellaceae bacterium]
MSEYLLTVKNLKTYFPIKEGLIKRTVGYVKAVEDVSFSVKQKQVYAIVGESGCGKSTAGKSIVRLIEPTAGEVIFDGKTLSSLSDEEMRLKRRDMQFIFQNPYSSLNPRMNVYQLLSEPLKTHFNLTENEVQLQILEMIDKIGITEDQLWRYPHQFSGGQKQRISIARALITKPRFVIADEPVSALDVSIQAQVLNLLINLQKEMELAMVFISHDLNVVRFISSEVAVMYLGSIMESGSTDEIYQKPLHPYSKALLDAVPNIDPLKKKRRSSLKGEVPNPANPPQGCPFSPRCVRADDICRKEKPTLNFYKGRNIACHNPLE